MSETEYVIIADSQFLVAETVRNMVMDDVRYSLSGVAVSKSELFKLLQVRLNTLLITDIATIDYNSIDDLKTIKELYPRIKVLVLTNTVSKNEFLQLSRIGIKNIVYKNVYKE